MVRQKRICVIDGCPGAFLAHGWCKKHYTQWYRWGDPLYLKQPKGPVEERFWPLVRRSESSCWEWQGGRDTRGYGVISGAGRPKTKAHRIAYELAKGPIPKGLYVCHTCDNPPCCRPDHLWLGTQAENMADRIQKGRGLSTHCKRGHARTPENTYVSPRGERQCRACWAIVRPLYRKGAQRVSASGRR